MRYYMRDTIYYHTVHKGKNGQWGSILEISHLIQYNSKYVNFASYMFQKWNH
jgi:hypothetical protein